jgi:P-loop containing dynein motor region D4
VGVGGSGKQSLCRLAAFISGFAVVQIVISSTYGVSDLKENLKAMYVTAGMKEEGVVLLLTDSQITDERFLIYINDLLASGNIPDLYTPEEVSASYIDHSLTRTLPYLHLSSGSVSTTPHHTTLIVSTEISYYYYIR